jgi:serine/threonine protein kinase
MNPNYFKNMKANMNKKIATPDGLDLILKMLEIDHNLRITARDALDHPYVVDFFKENKDENLFNLYKENRKKKVEA